MGWGDIMQQLQKSERPHIAFFGCTNSGKSSLVNAITNQQLSVVSDIKGTTTDPVSKSMELLPLGPVVIIDTPGIDDIGELGMQRVKKAKQVLNYVDIALLVIDAQRVITKLEEDLIEGKYKEKKGVITFKPNNKKEETKVLYIKDGHLCADAACKKVYFEGGTYNNLSELFA